MNMSSFWWVLFCAFWAFSITGVDSDTTAFPVIPKHLLECYMDDGIYHRANRMPSSIESFVDLIRKIEKSPTSRNMNARELSMVLLHFLKLDGIQSLQSHTKYLPHNILPFAPSGDEYFKHRLTLVGLVPRIDHNYLAAINETLTITDMCNLHFMLSYSVDPYKRNDERCTGNFGESKWQQPETRSDWDSYQNIHEPYKGYQRHKRNLNASEKSNRVDLGKENKEMSEKILNKRQMGAGKRQTLGILQHNSSPLHETQKEPEVESTRRKRNFDHNKNKKAEVEIIMPQRSRSASASSEKENFTIGNQELLSAIEQHHPKIGRHSLIQTQPFGRYGGRTNSRIGASMDENSYSGIIPGIPLSDCPAVNGIITTPFGSLAIGSVVAGIAAGLNPEEIPPTKLSVDMSELESPSDRIKNTWAVTLAGTIADTLSSSALLDNDNLQILKGEWNDTFDPKWYLLKTNQYKHLTEVALRGSLDGLFLGLSAREWTNKFSGLKLSQMLQTYYDCPWGKVGAKNRVELRGKLAPDEIFRKQVHLMSLVLKKQKTNPLTVLDFSHIVREAVQKVIGHIQNMDDNEKSYLGSFPTLNIDSAINTVAVVDSSWGYENIKKILYILRNAQVTATPESNLTVLCGNDGRILFNAESSSDIHSRFNRDTLFENCTRGMNYPAVFEAAEFMFRKVYAQEKTILQMNNDGQVLLLLPYDSVLQQNMDYAAEKSWYFRQAFPDVRLIIGANGRIDSFAPLVKVPKDLFPIYPFTSDPSMKSVTSLAEGMKQTYQRITRPSCGSYFNDQTEGGETRVTRDVMLGNVAYYRLLPQYFFTVKGQAVITIRSKLRAPLTVCHSREMDRPVGPSPRNQPNSDFYNKGSPYGRDYPMDNSFARQTDIESSVQCKTITSETYRIELNNPCEGVSTLEGCLPLYISLTAPITDNLIPCPTCRLFTNVQYEITASGLGCYNSASAILMSPLLVALVLILLYWNNQSL